MALQPARRTATYVAVNAGELLPHLLTLTITSNGGYFLLRYYALANISHFERAVLYAVRTFLPD